MPIQKTLNQLISHNNFSQLGLNFFTPTTIQPLSQPKLISFSPECCKLIGLQTEQFSELNNSQLAAELFSGNRPLPNSQALAMKYAGHQFGAYNPELGDGRGLLLGETEHQQQLWDIHLKGAGRTPYSRFGDGRAVLRSTIREYLCSEAMAALNIPTTRALCIIGSNEAVQRETIETGATLVRVARSHIRFGHFEHFFHSGQHQALQELADYVIKRHLPQWQNHPDKYQQLFRHAVQNTAILIAHWQAIGFTHGVLNTDNMSILGDSFDYGPYAFLDRYQPDFICNHSDPQGRYRFSAQPSIGLWNLNALAHSFSTLLPHNNLVDELSQYEKTYIDSFNHLMRKKLGLMTEDKNDTTLHAQLLKLMADNDLDYTLCFRKLCDFSTTQDNHELKQLFANSPLFIQWSEDYSQRLLQEKTTECGRQQQMRNTNPKYILRNYLAQQAIEQAQQDDFSEVNKLLQILSQPFDEQPEHQSYAVPPQASAQAIALSCSS